MAPVLRIHSRGVLAATVAGLTADQIVRFQARLSAGSSPVRPGFEASRPGELFLTGTHAELNVAVTLLRAEPGLPASCAARLESLLFNTARRDYPLKLREGVLDLGARTHIMGVLNVTPDSFSDGGQFANPARAVEHAREMLSAGADLIDIGGESTRPGATPLTEDEELRRIIPVIERIAGETSAKISVDTYKSAVAAKALAAGATIVNDISGLRFSPDMAKVVADHGAAVIIMHIKGTPRDMQTNPVYDDVIGEIADYLEEGIAIAVRAGVSRDKILVDPGIGFGKTLEHNLTILARLEEFRSLGCPLVLGTSRKRFIGTVLDTSDPQNRIEGTAATVALGIRNGAHIVRVHDVGFMAKVAKMTDAIVKTSTNTQAPNNK